MIGDKAVKSFISPMPMEEKMKRALFMLLFCGLFISGCGSSAPLEIVKASSIESLDCGSSGFTYTYSKNFTSVSEGQPECLPNDFIKTSLQAKNGHRFVVVEIAQKGEADIKFKPDETVLTDSAGKRFVPIGIAHPANLGSFKNFEIIKDGTIKMQSPDGTAVTLGKEQKDVPTTFSVSGAGAKAALFYEVPTESKDFQLKVAGSRPMTVKIQ